MSGMSENAIESIELNKFVFFSGNCCLHSHKVKIFVSTTMYLRSPLSNSYNATLLLLHRNNTLLNACRTVVLTQTTIRRLEMVISIVLYLHADH